MRSVLLERAGCPRHPSAFLLPPLGTATPAQLQASPRAGRAHTALICRFKARGGDPAPRGAAEAPLCSEGRGAGRELPGAVPGHTYAGHMPPSPPGEPLTCTALHPPLTCVARASPRPLPFCLGCSGGDRAKWPKLAVPNCRLVAEHLRWLWRWEVALRGKQGGQGSG